MSDRVLSAAIGSTVACFGIFVVSGSVSSGTIGLMGGLWLAWLLGKETIEKEPTND